MARPVQARGVPEEFKQRWELGRGLGAVFRTKCGNQQPGPRTESWRCLGRWKCRMYVRVSEGKG